MTDPTPEQHPLTDQALDRLRKLAEGNNVDIDKIELIESVEKIYLLEGVTQLVPFCEHSNANYPGPVKGQDRTVFGDKASLEQAVINHQKNFMEGRDWLPQAKKELEESPGHGWGLEGSKIALPEKSRIFAAVETCPSCQGRKLLTCGQCMGRGFNDCNYCKGRGLEFCYNCNGSGKSPQNQDDICIVCHGKRQIPCRWCKLSGKLPCPTCQGRGGTVCTTCRGNGRSTVEIGLACGATINFRFNGNELPSGLRRGIDRLGIANLIKGYADVRLVPEEKKEDEKPEHRNPNDPPKAAEPIVIRYEADLPYADLKMRFANGRAVLVNVFGKKASLMGVPPFLDEALIPARKILSEAARGGANLEDAMKVRVVRDAVSLTLARQGTANNLRRNYPVGLTSKVAQEILITTRRSLRHFTRTVRLLSAVAFGLLGAALLVGLMILPPKIALTQNWSWPVGLLVDFASAAIVMGISWVVLGSSVRFKLKRDFPGLKISLHGHAGPIGISMISTIFGAWLATSFLAPHKSPWVEHLLALFHH